VLEAGDRLLVAGTEDAVRSVASSHGLTMMDISRDKQSTYSFHSIGIAELVIMSGSRLINSTIIDSNLREQFGVTVLGIQRGGKYILENLKDQEIHSGDALLVQGTWENIGRLGADSQNCVVVGRPMEHVAAKTTKIPMVVAIIVTMIIVMATGLIPTVLAALLAGFAMIAIGCFRNIRDAYSFIGWETLIMISCMLPLATAMEKTGIVAFVGEHMASVGTAYGPLAALAIIYLVTSLLNIVISFTPLALLIAPIAMDIALKLNCNPLPFMFAVACAAGLCFASSFSTPSNAMVVSAGRYTFMDYVKIGLPLQLLLGVILIFMIPLLFPF
jgi:di/tricarboxylate transporter